MPWYLYLAIKQLFPTGRRFPFFTAISVVSVSLGVALLIVVLGVMGGFGYQIRAMITDTEGEIQIKSRGLISDYPGVVKKVAAVPGVAGATPYAAGMLMVQYQNKPAFPQMRGLDLGSLDRVVSLGKFVRIGSLEALDDDSVILSGGLADALGVRLGAMVDIYTPLMLAKKDGEIILPRTARVVGILEIGHQQLDSSTLYCTLRMAQDLYGLGRDVHGINLRVAPGAREDEVAARVNAILPDDVRAFSWRDSFADFLWVLQLEKNMMMFVLLFVVLVAAFLTMSLLLVLVLKKTREIGLLGALGASRRQIALCFCLQGVGVGVVGTGLGLALGFTVLHFRNDLVRAITHLTGGQELLARFYQFSELPEHLENRDLALIVVSALVLSTLAGIIPAVMAARLKPVEALRSE
ncbi:MAG: lipoprotein-releasing system permease protein [Verrucomicrobia bacterium]|jgi:lipoprotein-releasing system permease protein|nr:MAG: lipoprotein-releasing system permease protein [Verrucomicrobiota bacterium]